MKFNKSQKIKIKIDQNKSTKKNSRIKISLIV